MNWLPRSWLNSKAYSCASTVFVLMVAFSFSANAAPNTDCEKWLQPSESQIISDYLTKKYPNLKFITENPDSFVATMRARFDQQKIVEPGNPHNFDYTEVGLPGVQYAHKAIIKKIENLRGFLEKLNATLNSNNPINWPFAKKISTKIAEVEIALQYLADLQVESAKILAANHVSYRQSVEFLYFFSRAIGHFDSRQFPLFTRAFLAIDRRMQGYKQLSIAEEYEMYRNRQYSVFQEESSVRGFVIATKPFEEAFNNKKYLATIFVPSHEPIDRDILIRLLNKDINIIGVTANPIAADGFLRHGGDFWIHDVRHESAKLQKRQAYFLKNQPTEKQIAELDQLQEKWMVELHRSIAQIGDRNLREAVSLIAFNFNHDRGFPLIPSVWLQRDRAYVAHGLILMLTISGQGTGYWLPITNSLRARNWLTKFWQERAAQENAIFKGQSAS